MNDSTVLQYDATPDGSRSAVQKKMIFHKQKTGFDELDEYNILFIITWFLNTFKQHLKKISQAKYMFKYINKN